jgi:hypothetical protein
MTGEKKTFGHRCADIIDQEMKAISEFMVKAGEVIDQRKVADDSGLGKTMAWIRSLPTTTRRERDHAAGLGVIFDESESDLLRLIGNALDHAQTLVTALHAPVPPRGAALTLSRAILEAVLQVCTILDPHIRPSTALLRALAYEVATIEGNEETARVFGKLASDEQHRRSREAVDGLHAWLKKVGIDRGPKGTEGRRSVWVGLGGERVNIEFNATAAMKRYLDGEDYIYAVLSGAAHSRGWLLSTTFLPDDHEHVTTPEHNHLTATLPLLDASEALVKSIGYYTGLDAEPLIKKTHFRRRALLAGRTKGNGFSPMSVEDYRSKRTTTMGPSFTAEPGRWGLDGGK